ncbi:hypothetical protein C2G38_1984307, partial [Gigaspora rosea]
AVPLVKSICQSINEDIEVQEYKRLPSLKINQKSLDGDLKKKNKGRRLCGNFSQEINIQFI